MVNNISEDKVNGVRLADFYTQFKELEQKVKASELKERKANERLLKLWNKIK